MEHVCKISRVRSVSFRSRVCRGVFDGEASRVKRVSKEPSISYRKQLVCKVKIVYRLS